MLASLHLQRSSPASEPDPELATSSRTKRLLRALTTRKALPYLRLDPVVLLASHLHTLNRVRAP